MAGLLGVAKAGWDCCRPHTTGHRRRNGSARMAEKHVTQKWLDEYEEHSGNCCPVCGDPECQGNGPLEDKWYVGCYA